MCRRLRRLPDPSPPRRQYRNQDYIRFSDEDPVIKQSVSEGFWLNIPSEDEDEGGEVVGDVDAFAAGHNNDDPFYGDGIGQSQSLEDEWGISDSLNTAAVLPSKPKAPSTKGNSDDFEVTF